MNLRQLEARLQALVETRLIRLLPGQTAQDLMIQKLMAALPIETAPDQHGQRIAPNVYTLLVHPGDGDRWKDRDVLETLVEMLKTVGSEAGLRFVASPTLTLAESSDVSPGEFSIVASHTVDIVGKTQETGTDATGPSVDAEQTAIPERAYLIVEGTMEFPLEEAVINIGRRLDNSLVIDDPRVSRHHVQMRAIKGRFVLFDLDSSGGTYINGERSTQSILTAGDVISLAGVSLIFSQDDPLPQRDPTKASPQSEAGERRPNPISQPRTSFSQKKK